MIIPEKPVTILHLRASSDSGGGPENIILKSVELIDAGRFWFGVCYLRKKDVNIFNIAKLYEGKEYHFFELSGGAVDFKLLKSLAKLIKKYQIDILHAHDPKTYVYAYLLRFMFPDLKLVSTLHGWIHRRARSFFYAIVANLVLKRFDSVIAVSSKLLKQAVRSGIPNTQLIHNAIDTDEWKPNPASACKGSTPFIIAYIGRLSREKGPLDFVKVAKGIIEKDKFCRFVVAGDGPMLETTKQYVEELGLMSYFDFKGQITQKDMPSFYRGIDLVLSTSHTEGMPVTLLEALASGIPVVATNVGGVGELIIDGYNGLLTEKKDIESLISSVLLLKNKPELAESFRQNGRDIVKKNFSYLRWAEKMESMYLSLYTKDKE
ncbi:MAG: glycosyltransferase [Desulfobacteraceae bacterium]|jgi:glycosyltransferase involved in cell wall biosynthesis